MGWGKDPNKKKKEKKGFFAVVVRDREEAWVLGG